MSTSQHQPSAVVSSARIVIVKKTTSDGLQSARSKSANAPTPKHTRAETKKYTGRRKTAGCDLSVKAYLVLDDCIDTASGLRLAGVF